MEERICTTIEIFYNDPAFNNSLKQCFNLLLLTQGNKLHSMVFNNPSTQTLKMDGKIVEINNYGSEIHVN